MSTTLQLDRLPSYRRDELPLWNWYSAAFPSVGNWNGWLSEVAGQLLRQPGSVKARIVKTNLVDTAQPAERIPFDDPVLTIGRAPENTVVLPEGTITRQHARLRRDGSSILLEDLGSAMGTLRAGVKLIPATPVELTGGDDFVIFPHRFQVEVEREWLAGGRVDIWTPGAATTCWGAFSGDTPADWTTLAINVEPLGGAGALAADSEFLRTLAAGVLSGVEPEPAPWQPSSEAVIELILLAALERANRDLAFPFQFSLERFGRAPRLSDRDRGIALSAVLDLAGIRGAVRLFLPCDLLRRMQEIWTPKSAATLDTQALWRFPFRLGHVDLTAAEQRSIDPGDVVIYTADPALLFPGDDRKGFAAEWDGGAHVRLLESFDRRMTMAETAGPVPIDDLPMRVQVLVDEHELTVAQAARLAPGSVLDLDRDPRAPVRLAVNGRLIGTGELVEIEGRLGVRILTWSRE